MQKKSYHHGNLKQALIEAGIEMMNEVGEEGMSLRKISAKCGVSSAAPYAHFANMQELILAMQKYVTEEFMNCLSSAVERSKDPYSQEAFLNMGKAYIMFFIEHPQYYKFLYFHEFIKIDLSLDSTNNFPPFDYLRNLVLEYHKRQHHLLTKEQQEIEILKLWSDVQGLASIASMNTITWNQNWEDIIYKILCYNNQ